MGVASVGVLYATVRRASAPAAGLLAGAVLALTPVAVLMFRFNNPDALLVLLLIAAAYATLRADRDGRARVADRSPACSSASAFLTKMLQAFLVVPGLRRWPTCRRRRPRRGASGSGTCSPRSARCVVVGRLVGRDRRAVAGVHRGRTSAARRHNSILELTLGYNGLGRITGDETGASVALAGGGTWGATGLCRLFNAEIGGQIAWLIPAALILLVVGLWLTRRGFPRTDLRRAAYLAWGSWFVVTGPGLLPHGRHLPRRTTPSPWRRPSRRSSPSAPERGGNGGTPRSARSAWPSRWSRPASGPSFCSPG